MNNIQKILEQIKWNNVGLIPVIAQDHISKNILMLAWMNKESFMKTLEIGQAVYYSRSRKKLWHKGEESGHFQYIQSMHLDCDGDTLLILVEQKHGIACHTGRPSCFFYTLDNEQKSWEIK